MPYFKNYKDAKYRFSHNNRKDFSYGEIKYTTGFTIDRDYQAALNLMRYEG